MDDQQDVDFYEFDDLETENHDSAKYSLSWHQKPVDEAEIFKQRVHVLATKHLTEFFKNKYLHTGGKITKKFLLNDRRIQKVINYSIIAGVDHAYKAIGDSLPEEDDIKLVIDTLQEIGKYRHEDGSSIPIEFRGGMLCVYLELVVGYKF